MSMMIRQKNWCSFIRIRKKKTEVISVLNFREGDRLKVLTDGWVMLSRGRNRNSSDESSYHVRIMSRRICWDLYFQEHGTVSVRRLYGIWQVLFLTRPYQDFFTTVQLIRRITGNGIRQILTLNKRLDIRGTYKTENDTRISLECWNVLFFRNNAFAQKENTSSTEKRFDTHFSSGVRWRNRYETLLYIFAFLYLLYSRIMLLFMKLRVIHQNYMRKIFQY